MYSTVLLSHRDGTVGRTALVEQLTIAELAARTGISVRTIRFYAGMGLISPPTVRGRLGLYDERHIARLELVRDLQKLGFTLAAIEGYLARIPLERSPEDLALHRALLAPWLPEQPETVDRAELDARAGRTLDDAELARLTTLGVIRRHEAPDDAPTWTLTSTGSIIEHMFEIGQDLECDWPPPVTAPPEEVIDCLVEDQPGAGEPVRWSEYVPDGLLADILSRPSDGDPQHREFESLERVGAWERVMYLAAGHAGGTGAGSYHSREGLRHRRRDHEPLP
jgi:DNA-binding transcriptional MerR regulator